MALPDMKNRPIYAPAALFATTALLAGCATVKLEAPDKPIEINLNVNITQELLIKVDKDVEDLISSNPDIF
ncbi:MAG: YnbE family lipoprotein [Aquisalinus sp.]|nr:YnbE family lipoprotein [Aquisalinus sp.]MCI5048368.1 YnbE family lipoprotein [Aquisalinus sp.]